ncbi:MAG: metallophosphoesterase [Vicinamibacteria bacterium]
MRRKLLFGLPLAVGLLLGIWAFYWEPSSLEINRYPLSIPEWPKEQDGLRIALLSDLHVGSPLNGVDRLEEVVARVNEDEPHLVLLAGDYVIGGIWGGEFVPPEKTAAILRKLRAPLGVYAVLGNHDWWFDGSRVKDAFTSEGITVLDDESLLIQEAGHDFWLVGLGDLWEAKPNVESALANVPENAPIVAFTHNPDLFPDIPARVSLTLAGHTHGGQVKIPFVGTPVVPSHFGDRYARGWIVEDGRHLFVTSGVGTSILPVRFGVTPEIALLELRGRESRQTTD